MTGHAAAPEGVNESLFTTGRRIEAARIVLVGAISLAYWQGVAPLPVLLAAIAIGLYPLARTGLVELWREHTVGTELFVSVATLIAIAGREYLAGAVLMTIILIAEFIADLNTDRARASIKALIGSVPQTATMRDAGGDRTVPVSDLKPGDVVLVRAGEKIPVDGTVVSGAASVNESAMTGESLPVEKGLSASVLAGTLVDSGALDVRTDKVGADTYFARIIKLVEDADGESAPVQRLADRVAAWLLPIVIVFLVVVFVVTRDVSKVVALLIFTSPAELGLATPMVMIAAIARAARLGILVKGGLHLERLAKADVFVFDKTGTLTMGVPTLVDVVVHAPSMTEPQLLAYAAAADQRSSHPLASAVVAAARNRDIAIPEVQAFSTVHGRGVVATVDGRKVLVGNDALLGEHGVPSAGEEGAPSGPEVRVAVDGVHAGTLRFADQLRPGAAEALAALRRAGVKRLVMLTGDGPDVARAVAAAVGIDEVRASLLPDQKVLAVEELQRQGHTVAMVGDGVNDAPALVRADVGVAMGVRGTQAAIEAADVALMGDDLGTIAIARILARRAYRTVQENLIVGVGVVHVLGITAALAGWIGPIEAAMLHLGPDILVFLNSIKLLRVRLSTA